MTGSKFIYISSVGTLPSPIKPLSKTFTLNNPVPTSKFLYFNESNVTTRLKLKVATSENILESVLKFLSTFSMNAARQLLVLGHNSYPSCMDAAQHHVFKKAHHVGLHHLM